MIWKRRKRKGEQPWHFPPFLRFLRTKKDKKEGSSKPLDLGHHSICHTSFSPSHPRGCGGQKWRKFCTQLEGGEGNLWHQGGGFAKNWGENRFFLAFSRDAVRDRRIYLLATNWPSREEALSPPFAFFSPRQTPSFSPPSSLSSTHGRKEEGASRIEK